MERTRDTPGLTRRLLLASNAVVLAGALIASWPWTSGAYTWVAQRTLSPPAATPSAPRIVERSPAATPTAAPAGEVASEEASAWARVAEGEPLGRLVIPRLGLDATFVKGAHEADLRRGPGWVSYTSPPGRGNCAISGHRTTYLAPFRDIDRLVAGDTVRVETAWRRYTYRVTGRLFVERDDSDVLFPTRVPTLTLTSCHPPYSDRFRIIVQARLAKTERR